MMYHTCENAVQIIEPKECSIVTTEIRVIAGIRFCRVDEMYNPTA